MKKKPQLFRGAFWLLAILVTFNALVSAQDKAEIKKLIEQYKAGAELRDHQVELIQPYLQDVEMVQQDNSNRPFNSREDILMEDFSDGALPAGWQNVDNTTDGGGTWFFDNPGGRVINTTTADNGFAIFDSDYLGMDGFAENADLITPPMDLTGNSEVYLEFEHYCNAGYGGLGELFVSADSGDTWVKIDSFEVDTDNAELYAMNVSSLLAGSANAMVKWKWIGDWSYYWAVDDVKVYEPSGEPVLAVSPDSLEFDLINIGDTSDAQTITISNSGAGTLTVNSASIVSGEVEDFAVDDTNSYPLELGFGEEAYVDVMLTPVSEGMKTATFEVVDNNSNSETVALIGEAVDPVLTPPFTEEFSEDFPPLNWVEADAQLTSDSELDVGFSSWTDDDFANNSDNSIAARLNIYGTSGQEWLVTPEIDLGARADYQLEYDLALTEYSNTTASQLGDDDTLALIVSTDGETWSKSNIIKLYDSSSVISNTGQAEMIDLSAYSGSIWLAFYGASSVDNEDNDVFIDNFSVVEISTSTPDWYNLQWPPNASVTEGNGVDVYAQTWIDGVTSNPGATDGLEVWVGYSTEDTDPSTWQNWVEAEFNQDAGDNDEFVVFGFGSGLPPGEYYYASRFRYQNGPFVYGGINSDGSETGPWGDANNGSGELTVQPIMVMDFPYFESFEGDFPPVGWTNSDWEQSTSNSYDSSSSAYHTYLSSGDFISPAVDLTQIDEEYFEFYWGESSLSDGTADSCIVSIWTEDKSWSQLGVLSSKDVDASDWLPVTFDLSAFTDDTVKFKWDYQSDGSYSAWSIYIDAITLMEFTPVDYTGLVINEINYNPVESGSDTTEFIELYNNSDQQFDLSGVMFKEGFEFTFPDGAMIEPAEYLVLTIDTASFMQHYGYEADYQWASGALSNGGEGIALEGPFSILIDSVDFSDGGDWPGEADGNGPSLELIDPVTDNNAAANWQASYIDGGTPGEPNSQEPEAISPFWEQNQIIGNTPDWFGGTTERGLAYGNVGGNDRLYVASREQGTIMTLDAATGDEVTLDTPFDLSGLSGGTFAYNDIGVSSDGIIFLGNLATSGGEWQLYIWTNEGGAPEMSHSFTLQDGERVGDKFTVVGSWTDGNLEVWAPVSSSDPGKIYVYRTEDQGNNWTTTTITLSGDYTATVGNTSVAPFEPGGAFYITGNGMQPRMHDFSGEYVANSFMGGVTSSHCAIKNVTGVANEEFVFIYSYREHDDAGNSGPIIGRSYFMNVTDPTAPSMYGETPAMSDAASFGAINGDVDFMYNGDGTVTLFVLAPNQGLGAYVTQGEPVPVELTGFNATVSGNNVKLTWSTSSETNNSGFEIQRSADNTNFEKVGFVEGNGTTNDKSTYSFSDDNLNSGKYYYRLKQVDMDGTYSFSDKVEVKVAIPDEFALKQNYPNPFNPSTTIRFDLPVESNVNIKLFNMLGQQVTEIVDKDMKAGIHKVNFNAANIATGVYIYTIKAQGVNDNEFVDSRKMMLLK